MMQITYTPTLDDTAECAVHLLRTSPRLRAANLGVYASFVAAAGIAYFGFHSPFAIALLIVVLIGGPLDWVPSLRKLMLAARGVSRKTLVVLTVTLSAEGYGIGDRSNSVVVAWSQIEEIGESRHLLIFRTDRRHALFVPKHAFHDPDEAARFLATATAYRRATLEGQPLALPSQSPDAGHAGSVWPPPPAKPAPVAAAEGEPAAATNVSTVHPEDMVEFQHFFRRGDRDRRAIAILAWFVAVLGLVPVVLVPGAGTLLGLCLMLPLAAFYTYWLPPVRRWVFTRQVPKGHSGLREQQTVLTSTGMVLTTDKAVMTYPWSRVVRISETENLLVFVLGPQIGHLIPKRAFVDGDAARAFLETAQSLRATALGAGNAFVTADKASP